MEKYNEQTGCDVRIINWENSAKLSYSGVFREAFPVQGGILHFSISRSASGEGQITHFRTEP